MPWIWREVHLPRPVGSCSVVISLLENCWKYLFRLLLIGLGQCHHLSWSHATLFLPLGFSSLPRFPYMVVLAPFTLTPVSTDNCTHKKLIRPYGLYLIQNSVYPGTSTYNCLEIFFGLTTLWLTFLFTEIQSQFSKRNIAWLSLLSFRSSPHVVIYLLLNLHSLSLNMKLADILPPNWPVAWCLQTPPPPHPT